MPILKNVWLDVMHVQIPSLVQTVRMEKVVANLNATTVSTRLSVPAANLASSSQAITSAKSQHVILNYVHHVQATHAIHVFLIMYWPLKLTNAFNALQIVKHAILMALASLAFLHTM